jgi:membrane protein DedA with SNARE-associated domain
MDLQPYLHFLADHPFSVVFLSSLIEAAGLPFPSRVILVLTPAFLATERDLVWLIVVATVGAVLGDHVPYLAGRVAGTRLLGFYCRVTLASDACIETTLSYFRRFGSAALLFSRFSASVRIFASACAGCSDVTYTRFVTFDSIGTLVYTSLIVLVGWLVGERAVAFLTTDRRRWIFLGVAALAFVTLIGYRLWRRRRDGRAQAGTVERINLSRPRSGSRANFAKPV